MKVYWAKTRGAVITSANLSTFALGRGGLLEAGIRLGPDELDIRRLVRQLDRRPAGPELRRLDFAHKDYYKRFGWRGLTRSTKGFQDWFTAPERERWKIFFYHTVCSELSVTAMRSIREEFDKKPNEWIWTKLPKVRENDWILCGYVRPGKSLGLSWLFADRVVAVPKSDKHYDPDFPYEVIQIHSMRHYPPPPFVLKKQIGNSLGRVLKGRISNETMTPFELTSAELERIRDDLQGRSVSQSN